MELRTYWKILLRRWWLVVVPVVVVDLTVDSPKGIPAMAELVKMRSKQIGCEKEHTANFAAGGFCNI